MFQGLVLLERFIYIFLYETPELFNGSINSDVMLESNYNKKEFK